MLLTPEIVFRRYITAGVPDSGAHDPLKSEIIQLLNLLFGVSRGGWVVARTVAELNAITPENAADGGVVLTGAGAGYYDRDGSAWVFGRGFPDTFAKVALSGSGTAQTGVVNAGVNPASIEVFFAKVATPNTGPMTLSISGGPTRSVRNLAGNPLSAGEWTGMVMFYLNDAGQYQLLIDAGAAASASASANRAEDEADRAQTIADGIAPGVVPNGGVTDPKLAPGSNVQKAAMGEFDTLALAVAATVPASVSAIALRGRNTVGDFGPPAHFTRMSVAPTAPNALHFQSADGAWWMVSGKEVDVRWLGVFPDGIDAGATVQACWNAGIAPLIVGGGVFNWTSTAVLPSGGDFVLRSDKRTRIRSVGDYALIYYKRSAAVNGTASNLTVIDCYMQNVGAPGTGRAIWFEGLAGAADNFLNVIGGQYNFFDVAFYLQYCGGEYRSLLMTGNDVGWFLGVNAGFIHIDNVICGSGKNGIVGNGGPNTGISNTIWLLNSLFISNTLTDIDITGYDAIHIQDCGFDLGGAGTGVNTSALKFTDVSTLRLAKCTVSSIPISGQLRTGVELTNCHFCDFDGTSVYNCGRGVVITGPASIPTMTRLTRLNFLNNPQGHVIIANANGGTIADCVFDASPDRVSNRYEIQITGTISGWNVGTNRWNGAAIVQGQPGLAFNANNLVATQMWGNTIA